MKTIEVILSEERNQLENVVEKARRRLVTMPEGNLRIKKKRSDIEYYYKSKDTSVNGRYIKKSEKDLARRIAQKEGNEYVRNQRRL